MSSKTTNVDEHVVQMTFNNAEFEKGVSTTLSTLERLKRSLNFKARPTGLEDLGRAVGLVEKNLQPMANDIDHIASRFTALGIIGDQVIRNLTNRVVAFGEKMVKSVTTEPLTSGFSEYETQMKSIQTILANTGMEGVKGVARVNAALDELNKYADKTIYNFTQMTENIGRFTAAGVKLDPSVKAIKGTANLAALSGSTSEQAARAMYNLSQALSTGTLKLMDWNSVVNAGMGGQVFQNALIQAAATLDGMGDKIDEWKAKNVDAFGGFRESLSKGWITSDVLGEALKNFTYDVAEGTKEYEEALKELVDSGYTEEVAKDILKMARQATEAATKVRTFTQLVDTLKEALGSGWTESWRLIFGDFLEATELWTGINDVLSEFIENTSKARNEILRFWHDADEGGRADFIEAFKELVYDIALIVRPIKMAFDDVFGAFDNNAILNATKAFKRFAESLHPSVEGFYSIHRIATAVFKILKSGFSIVGKGASMVLQVGRPLLYLADALLVALGNILEAIDNNSVFVGFLTILSRIGNAMAYITYTGISILVNGIFALGSAIKNVGLPDFSGAIDKASKSIKEFVKHVPLLNSGMKIFKGIVDGSRNTLDAFVKIVASGLLKLIEFGEYISNLPVISNAIKGFKDIFGGVVTVLTSLATIVRDIFKSIGNLDLTKYASPLEFIQAVVTSVFNTVVNGVNNLIQTLNNNSFLFRTFSGMVNSVVTAFKNGIGVIKDFFFNMKGSDADFSAAREGLDTLVEGIKNLISVVTPGRAAALAITMVMLTMSLTFIRIGNLFAKTISLFNGLIGTVKAAVNGFVQVQSNRIIQAAEALLMVATSLAIVAGIPASDLERALDAIMKLTALMGGIVALVEWLRSRKTIIGAGGDITNNITNLGGIALMILEIEAALGIMVKTLQELKSIDLEGVKKNLGAVMVAFSFFTAIAVILDKTKVGFSKGTIGILILTAALWSLTNALTQLKELSANKIKYALQGLVPLFITLASVSFAAKGIGLTTGMGIILTAKAIESIIPQLKALYHALEGFEYWEALGDYITEYKEALNIVMSFVLALTGIVGFFGKNLQKAGVGILAMAGSMYVMVFALDKLTEVVQSANIVKAGFALAGISAIITAWLVLSRLIPEKSSILKVGAAIALMSASLLIINLAIAQLAGMDMNDGFYVASGIVAGMMALLGAIIFMASKAAETKGAFGIISAMMLGLTVMIAELIALSFMQPRELVVPLMTILGLMGMMALILNTLKGVTSFNKEAVAGMVAVIFSILSITASLYNLAQLDPKNILAAGASMAAVLYVMGTVYKTIMGNNLLQVGSNGTSAWVTLVGMAVAIYAMGEALTKLAEFNWEQLLGATGSLSVVMLVMGKVLSTLVSLGADVKKAQGVLTLLVGGVLAMGAVAGALWLLSEYVKKPEELLEITASLAIGMLAIGALLKTLNGLDVGTAAQTALAAAVGIFVFVASMIALFVGIGGLLQSVKSDFGLDVLDILQEFAEGLGEIIGRFVGGIGEGAIESFSNICIKLGELAQNAEKIKSGSFAGIVDLAGAMAAITASGLLDSVGELFGFKSQIDKMNEILPALGTAIVGYNNALSVVDKEGSVHTVDFSNIEPSTKALKQIAEAAAEIPNTGGLVAGIFGDSDIETFGNMLDALGEGVKKYANKVNRVSNWDNVEPSIKALSIIANGARDIPNSGGLWGMLWGDNNVDVFGDALPKLASGLSSYAKTTGTVANWKGAEDSITILKKLADTSSAIPNSGFSFLSILVGDNGLDQFGQTLTKFAKAFVKFNEDVNEIDTNKVNAIATSFGNLVNAFISINDLRYNKIRGMVPAMEETLNELSKVITDTIPTYKDDVVEAITELINGAIWKSGVHNKKFRDLGIDYANSLGDGMKVSATSLSEDISILVGNAFDKVSDDLKKKAYENGAELGDEYVKGIVGPDGIDPTEEVHAGQSSDRVVDDMKTLLGNAVVKGTDAIQGAWEKGGAILGDTLTSAAVGNFSIDGLLEKGKGITDTIGKIASGEMTFTDALSQSGSDLYKSIFGEGIFKDFTKDLNEGTDIEKEFTKGLDDLGIGADGASKSMKGLGKSASSALKSAEDKLKTYNKYLKYSALVEAEFAKTTGAAMTEFTGASAADNAKKAVAALAEQIYADSKKIQDSIEETGDTAEDKAIAVMKAFNEDYEAIKNSVGDSIDLFKNFYSDSTEMMKGDDILRNAQSQIDGYRSLIDKYQLLAARGVPTDYIQKLAERGSEGMSELNSLVAMSTDQLSKFISVWEESQTFSDNYAAEVMSAMATAAAVKNLKAQAAGYKPVNKALKENYALYNKLYKDIYSKGGDPTQDALLITVFNEINRLCEETSTSLEEVSAAMEENSGAGAAAALEMIEKYTEASSVLNTYNSTFAEVENNMMKLMNDQLDTFETFTKKTGISSDDMIDILESQAKGVAQWSKELSSLASRGLNRDILQDLANLGPEGYEKVHAFYKMTSDEIARSNELYAQKLANMDLASRGIATQFSNAAVGGAQAYSKALEDVAESKGTFESAINAFSTTVTAGITEKSSADLIAGGSNIGKALTDSVAKAIEDNKSTTTNASKEMAKEATDEAAKTVKEESDKTVSPAAKASSEGVVAATKKIINANAGEEIMNDMTKGMSKALELSSPMMRELETKASRSARMVIDAYRSKEGFDEHSPSVEGKKIGEDFIDGVGIGIEGSQDYLNSTAIESATSATDVFSQALDAGLNDAANKKRSIMVGNVDINARPVVDLGDGNYATTLTAFQEKWIGDEDTGHYRIGHFTTIKNDGTILSDQQMDEYIDKVLSSNDPFGVDATMDRLLYMITDTLQNGEYITDKNLEQAFAEASAWDDSMHNRQAEMYGSQFVNNVANGITAGQQTLKNAATQSSNAVVNTYKQGLGENSPSELSEQLGVYWVLGFINGLHLMEQSLINAAMSSVFIVTQMTRDAIEQASLLDDVDIMNPVITPVIDLSAAQNGFNVLGNMIDSAGFNVGFTPQLGPVNPNVDRSNMIEALNATKYNDSRIVNEVDNLRRDINELSDKVGNLQVVMDSGALVGSIGPKMDTELGTIYRRRNRG